MTSEGIEQLALGHAHCGKEGMVGVELTGRRWAYPIPLKGVAAKHWPMVQAIMRIRVTR